MSVESSGGFGDAREFDGARDLEGARDLDEARDLIRRLRDDGGPELRRRPVGSLTETLGQVGRRFLDSDDPLRREALERIPEDAGLSPEMAEVVVDGMARDWTPERLEALVRSDLPDPAALDGPVTGPGGDRTQAVGDRFAFHLASGSVPGVGATSLLRSLLVKTPLLLKPGWGDRVLPELVARGIGEADPALAEACAVVYWPGGSRPPIEEAAFEAAERVVVYGGAETIRQVRARLPADCPLVAYGHRVSVGLVSREGLDADFEGLAHAAARAVALFDQRGCVSPHMVWVEEGGMRAPAEWAEAVAAASEAVARELPPGALDPTEASRIQQVRASLEVRAAMDSGGPSHGPGADADPGAGPDRNAAHGRNADYGRGPAPSDGLRLWTGRDLAWTVVHAPDPAFVPSCLGRTLRIAPVDDLARVPRLLAPHRSVLQSAALECGSDGDGAGSRRDALARQLAHVGITRVTTFARQPWPPAWWRHDGRGPLEVLLRWVSMEGDG